MSVIIEQYLENITVSVEAITNDITVQVIIPTEGIEEAPIDGIPYSRKDAGWIALSGDMLKANYDPTAKNADVFAMDSMVEGTTTKILTNTERTAISANSAKVSNVAHPLVETAVPLGAVFTDTVYTHPTNHPPSIILQDTTNRFVTDAEKSTWNAKADVRLANLVADLSAAEQDGIKTKLDIATSDFVIEEETGTSYTITTVDRNKIKVLTNASTITAPTPTGNYEEGNSIVVVKGGAGDVNFGFADWLTGNTISITEQGKSYQLVYMASARNISNWMILGVDKSYSEAKTLDPESLGFRELGLNMLSKTLGVDFVSASGNLALSSGNIYLMPFYLSVESSVTGFMLHQDGAQAAYTSSGANGVGLYGLDVNGDYELLTSITSPDIWKGYAYGVKDFNFSTGITLSPGIYFCGLIFNGTSVTVAPILPSIAYSAMYSYSAGGISPYHMTGSKAATSLPSSIVKATVSKNDAIIITIALGNPL